MNLTSCENCGVVLDKDKLNFPCLLENDDGSIDIDRGVYNSRTREYTAYVDCPVCRNPVMENP